MEVNVAVNEKLDRNTCAALLAESIKYLLFHRFQIPSPFDQFKAEDERDRKTEEQSTKPLLSIVKKKRQLIVDIDQLLSNIYSTFLKVDIANIALCFGSTVNPKETYSIKVRSDDITDIRGLVLTGKENGLAVRSKFVDKCCRILARTLFTDPILDDLAELNCTSINCFILAPRNAEVDWFKPKSAFKLPKKGKIFAINIEGDVTEDSGEGEGELGDYKDHLWFQSPVVLKGYKEVYRETVGSSLWDK